MRDDEIPFDHELQITLNQDRVVDLYFEKAWDEFIKELKQSFKPCTSLGCRFFVPEETYVYVSKMFVDLHVRTQQGRSTDVCPVMVELLRLLRNVLRAPEVHAYMSGHTVFLKSIRDIVRDAIDCEHNDDQLMRVALQLLCNFTTSNKANARTCYDIFSMCVWRLLEMKMYLYETSALLYNFFFKVGDDDIDFTRFKIVLDGFNHPDINNEYFQFIIDNFFCNSPMFWSYFNSFNIDQRLAILLVMKENLIDKQEMDLPAVALDVLSSRFTNSGSIIFQTVENKTKEREPYEVTLLLDVLASLSAKEKYLTIFQKNNDLLVMSGTFLMNIHTIGKASENYFSAVQKLRDLKEPSKEIKDHPAFGFKVGLVRLIANLCWRSKEMQDLTRESELIPILLDCCNVDARNPFIMQWVILAVRNLCLKNTENQQVVASLHQEGVVNNEALEELGLTLETEGENKIKFKRIRFVDS